MLSGQVPTQPLLSSGESLLHCPTAVRVRLVGTKAKAFSLAMPRHWDPRLFELRQAPTPTPTPSHSFLEEPEVGTFGVGLPTTLPTAVLPAVLCLNGFYYCGIFKFVFNVLHVFNKSLLELALGCGKARSKSKKSNMEEEEVLLLIRSPNLVGISKLSRYLSTP